MEIRTIKIVIIITVSIVISVIIIGIIKCDPSYFAYYGYKAFGFTVSRSFALQGLGRASRVLITGLGFWGLRV